VDSTQEVQTLATRLDRIEETLRLLIQQRVVQKYYSTNDIAKILGKAEFTVREWCRNGRIRAEKRPCGRGNSKEWMISSEELERIKAQGLLSRN
jgi:transposase